VERRKGDFLKALQSISGIKGDFRYGSVFTFFPGKKPHRERRDAIGKP
jgi:hypothetical protein